jgi:hypothetical protein
MRVLLLTAIVVAGVLVMATSGYYLLQDWAALRTAYARFERLMGGSADLRALFIAEAQQDAFRINCFAEGIGVLMGAILVAIGLHGLAQRQGNR